MEKDLVEPGTVLAYSEEYLPGPGVWDDGTQLRAALFGTTDVDPKTMTIQVRAAGRSVAVIERGDIVVGEVTYIKPDLLASVKIYAVRGKEDRSVLQVVDGTLHVSKIDARYIQDVSKEYHTGDLIRAKVIAIKGGPQLATDRPDLGCIRATSPDGNIMVREGRDLRDPETGRIEYRKIADDYGSGQV